LQFQAEYVKEIIFPQSGSTLNTQNG